MEIFEVLPGKLARHEVANFKAWLYTVAKNHCLMKLRSSGLMKLHSLDPELVQTADEMHLNDEMDKEVRLDQLSDCISALSTDQKTVISLFYLENKCCKQIELITWFECNKVRSLIHNGRRNLRLSTAPASRPRKAHRNHFLCRTAGHRAAKPHVTAPHTHF